ncbi:MAG: hypothetical protein ACK5D5_07190 [Bacteroidota bacterium]|jgi:LSD1 subclass zinc finger protein
MSSTEIEENASANKIKCKSCGAFLTYQAGTTLLKCEYCSAENEIKNEPAEVKELDFNEYLASLTDAPEQEEVNTVKCSDCGANTTLKPNVTSDNCPYCATPLILENATAKRLISPSNLLPFKVERKAANELFLKWVKALWFAPNDLKNYASNTQEKLNGIYIPFWTYDSNTYTEYSGSRGDHYYVTEYYTDSEGNQQSRQVRRTMWTHVSGWVNDSFDDVLVCASKSLPVKLMNELEPWDLNALENFNSSFLSGFRAESYQIDLAGGWEVAKGMMDPKIRSSIYSDIGGDEQRISSMNVQYNDITFKHILLPVWLSAYRYNGKIFRFMINARTGEVQGERPYSFWKIFLLVLGIIAAIAVVYIISKARHS